MGCYGKSKASIVQRGAEGPDALQVLIKAPMLVSDLEGCSPLQPRKQKTQFHGSFDEDEMSAPCTGFSWEPENCGLCTTIGIALPGSVSRTKRRVSTVAAVKSPRANPIQMPIAPALNTNARRYAVGMVTPQ